MGRGKLEQVTQRDPPKKREGDKREGEGQEEPRKGGRKLRWAGGGGCHDTICPNY